MFELNTNDAEASRILVVDDDLTTRLTLTKIIQKEGHEVFQALNGQAALEWLETHSIPDLVLLDVVMPDMDGFEVCEHIRKLDANVPIVMLTGLDDVTAVDNAFAKGATDFITKPINWALLIRRVRYSLRTYRITCALDQVRTMQNEAQGVAQLGFFEWCPKTDTLDWAPGLIELFQLPETVSQMGLEGYLQRVESGQREHVRQQLEKLLTDEHERAMLGHGFKAGDGDRHVRMTARKTSENTILCVLQDVTDFWQARQTIEFQRHHDNLTQLSNRKSFQALLAKQLEQVQPCAVVTLDVARFHMINDSFGQVEGDKLLQLFSLRLQSATQGLYPMARLGADEFAILIPELDDQQVLINWIADLQLRLGAVYELGGQPIFIETSVGIAISPDHGSEPNQLISAAIQARQVAKKAGGSRYKIFDESCQADYARRLYIESELRHALEKHQFKLLYQPQLDAHSNRIVGVEALIRWIHPEMGMVSPAEFIPIAEQMELIHSIGYWVAEEAIRQASEWYREGLGLRVGINLSGRQFMDGDLASKLGHMIRLSGLPPKLLDLEITESVAMDNPDQALFLLSELKQLGVTLAIDDFGTGYSSLEYLQKFCVDFIKIDRAFIKNLVHNPADQGIVKAVLGIAESLNMRVIAEGVETAEELSLLTAFGCDEIQGFFISRPVPAAEIPSVLIHYHSK
ncbi:EAL domain-containing protein [Marinobacterium sp. BA1]|uniref:two-component system response regulator n=1 Tax=Marinobacterium sp. BA1 TaxID=3138931 RepID=UPI0032E7EAA2